MFDVLNASVITSTYIQGTPMSNLTQYKYPMDPTGTNPKNKIIGERHTVSALAGTDFRLIIPKDGPFHKDSVKIKHVATGEFLIPEIDFTYSYYFEGASSTEPYPSIFGGISLLTSDYDGATLELTEYQTLGAEHVLNEQSLITLLTNVLVDPRTTTWDSVTYKPGYWTPDSHLTHAEETVGYSEMVAVLNQIADKYNIQTQQLVQYITSHMRDEADPHNFIGLADARYMPLGAVEGVKLDGPIKGRPGQTLTWDITNYDSFTSYMVTSATKGFVVAGKQIKFVIPGNQPLGKVQFHIGSVGTGRRFEVTIANN